MVAQIAAREGWDMSESTDKLPGIAGVLICGCFGVILAAILAHSFYDRAANADIRQQERDKALFDRPLHHKR